MADYNIQNIYKGIIITQITYILMVINIYYSQPKSIYDLVYIDRGDVLLSWYSF